MPINIFRDVFRFGREKFSFGGPKASGGAWTPAKLSGYAAEWDFGGTLPSKPNKAVAERTTTNLIIAPERQFAATGSFKVWTISAGSAATDDFAADPIGGLTVASRLNLIANGYANQSCLASSGGKTVTFSAYIKANSGSPSIKLGITDSVTGLTYGANQSITNGWLQYSYTVTLGASSKVSAVHIQDTGSGSDVQVYGVQLEEKASASVYVPATWEMQLDQRSTGCTQNSGYVSFSGSFGSSTAFGEAVSAVTTTTNKFVFSLLCRQPAADALAGYGPIANFPGNDTAFIVASDYAASPVQNSAQCYFGGIKAQAVSALRGASGSAGNWRILTYWCDASFLYVSLEGVVVRKKSWAGSSAAFKRLVLNNLNTIMPCPSDIAYGVLCTDCSSSFATGILPNLVTFMQGIAAQKSLTVCPGNAIVNVMGDSFSDPTVATGNWVYITSLRVTPNLYDSTAVSGSSWTGGTTYAQQRDTFIAQYNLATLAHSVVVLAFGQNDLNSASDQSTTLLAQYAAAYTQLKADGVKKIVAVPPWSRSVGANQAMYDTARANFRAGLVVGTHCDYVTPTSSFMSANGSFTTNPTYYVADGSHPSTSVGATEIDVTIGPTIATAVAA